MSKFDLSMAFVVAAKKDDAAEMMHLIKTHPQIIDDAAPLFYSFYDALKEDRLATAKLILKETHLSNLMPEGRIRTQAAFAGKRAELEKICKEINLKL